MARIPLYAREAAGRAIYPLPARVAAARARGDSVPDRKLTVFVSQQPRAREAKLAKALRDIGYRVVLIYRREPNWNPAEYFTRYHRVSGGWEAVYRASRYRPIVYHVFTSAWDTTTGVFVANKPGLVVYDTADVADICLPDPELVAKLMGPEVTVNRGDARVIRLQNETMAQVDALCCKDVQIKVYERKHRTRLTPLKLWLPDCCDFPPKPLPKRANNEIHVVNTGFLPDESHTSGGWLPFIEAMANKKIHVHLYPSAMWFGRSDWKSRYGVFFDLAEKTGHVHMHQTVPYTQVVEELRQYDFGLSLGYTGNQLISDEHLAACGSLRLADYLEAGLGLIINRSLEHMRFIARRYTTVVDVERIHDPDFRDQLVKARAAITAAPPRQFDFVTRAHIGRLASFYDRVAGVQSQSASRQPQLAQAFDRVAKSV